ncbi:MULTISPECIES: transglycosylase family protein [Streptomyces]|uniref:Transglycosylase family protein n=1 Tax=Streptomyces glycanivorans TaxID=3033808 RepID=A0ABY9JE22_9ACTN|nr:MULTISPECIES: transglycosylase family protein [unclassified Streptomyces]TXS09351.1 LysM peptidoglycan-binding domain-containing protein [Streptomyces sp. wa22]WLQ65970.1 transglycosylase family protein [Streptomyces sp. Alt3]WSQ79409.1 transglycosylase family protein [Streptomyces sp. NBC_01213]
MGSATGRHRRPRQAPAIVVAAGVTGSAIAIPLLGAGGAQAADASTWDRVAECESGGMWSADLGNGYYGGLQFSEDTWSAYGGTAYASRADLASRSQQISVAEKVLEDKGPQAWPSCAVISGLALDGTLPGIDPGGDPSAEDSDTATGTPSSEASDPAGSADDAESEDEADEKGESKGNAAGDTADASDDAGSTDASPSATPSPEASETSGAAKGGHAAKGDAETGGKHRGTPAPEGSTGSELDEGRESGRHASRGDSEARQGAEEAYTVREGDNLWAIADAQELSGGWTALYEANKDELGSDPDLILPGQSLNLGLVTDAQDSAAETAAAN